MTSYRELGFEIAMRILADKTKQAIDTGELEMAQELIDIRSEILNELDKQPGLLVAAQAPASKIVT